MKKAVSNHNGSSPGENAGMVSELEKMSAALESQKAEYDHLNQRYLRLAADFDNFRKRTRTDMGEMSRQVLERFVLAQLDVLDNMERALENDMSAETHEAFRDGVVMIYSQFRKFLEKEGLSSIEAKGKRFDPMLHEAVSVLSVADLEDDTVMEVIQKGYRFNDRLLRPSRVVVSKNPISPVNHSSINEAETKGSEIGRDVPGNGGAAPEDASQGE